jgi:hypothetical protein
MCKVLENNYFIHVFYTTVHFIPRHIISNIDDICNISNLINPIQYMERNISVLPSSLHYSHSNYSHRILLVFIFPLLWSVIHNYLFREADCEFYVSLWYSIMEFIPFKVQCFKTLRLLIFTVQSFGSKSQTVRRLI